MSRRSVPSIQPTDLRDVASEERVERIWGRLEQDLVTLRARPAGRPSRAAVWAVAATFAAFGVGLFAGRVVWRDRAASTSPVVATNDRATVDVFAAGSQQRTYSLPGGGSITLEPGSMVEVERAGGSDVRLRLLSGEASLDTAQAPDRGLAIVSGDATVATSPGSTVRVAQRADKLHVNVMGGSAEVSSPAGKRSLAKGQADEVPMRAASSVSNPSAVRVVTAHGARHVRHDGSQAAVAVAPNWHDLHVALKYEEAFEALKQQPGGVNGAIKSAKSADELYAIADVLRYNHHDNAAGITALRRITDEFGATKYGPIAAKTLTTIYEASGNTELASKYREQAARNGVFGEDAFCDQMRLEREAGNKIEASKRATEYLGKYPNGRCKDDAKRILTGGDADEDTDAPDDAAPAPSGSVLPAAPVVSGAPVAAPSSAPSSAPKPN
jgi:hypothetical protein